MNRKSVWLQIVSKIKYTDMVKFCLIFFIEKYMKIVKVILSCLKEGIKYWIPK